MKTMLVWLLLLLSVTLAADPVQTIADPKDEVIKAQAQEIIDLKALVGKEESKNDMLFEQRNKAYDQLAKEPTSTPFYLWVLVGAAGSAFLIKGFGK